MTPTLRTIELSSEQLMAVEAGPGERLRVLYGAAWLTQEGEWGDAVLRPGAEWRLRSGPALIQALGPTRLQMLGAGRPPAAWQRLLRALRRGVVRLQLGPVQPEPMA